jgi:hypothetical protein
MSSNDEFRSEVLRISRGIKDYVQTINADNRMVGAALLEVGLQVATADSKRPASAAEKKLIRAHHPKATEESIAAHRLTKDGLSLLLSLVVGFARKYLDHQPEACAALDACPDDAAVSDLVAVVTRNMKNAYASARSLGVSTYDVAAAAVTNASIIATERGVPLEQLAIIHLEAIERALEQAEPRDSSNVRLSGCGVV